MLTEIRKIIFPDDDLITGIVDHMRATSKELPRGAVTSLEIVKSPELHVVLYVHDVANDESHSFPVDPDNLVRAMVRYCINNKIPIPKNAKKSAEKIDETMALSILIDDEIRKIQDTSHYILL